MLIDITHTYVLHPDGYHTRLSANTLIGVPFIAKRHWFAPTHFPSCAKPFGTYKSQCKYLHSLDKACHKVNVKAAHRVISPLFWLWLLAKIFSKAGAEQTHFSRRSALTSY